MAAPGTNTQPTDAPHPVHAPWAPANTSQFHGPHFVCNLEGLALEVKDKQVIAAKFNGGRSQQWLLQPDPTAQGRTALASLLNGTYIEIRSPVDPIIQAGKTPFYWEVTEKGTTYRLGEGQDTFALPLLADSACTIKTIASLSEGDASSTLLILGDSHEVQNALRIGKIGQWAYPEQSVYHTAGQAGQIRVYNHLDSSIYAAVSSSGLGVSNCTTGQWTVKSNNWQYWIRASDESVHVSRKDCIGAQSAQVFQGRVGKTLHIQSLSSTSEWQGIKSVSPADADYTANTGNQAHAIGVKNNLSFSIYVTVLSCRQGGEDGQWPINPGGTSFWQRRGPEIVLVSVGSTPGAPRAFLGKIGFTLHINDL